ncbi:MAG TPA: MFS transporter [Stellaceae bacterium]|nr:MFS transporter [Stellaceae bacterium]
MSAAIRFPSPRFPGAFIRLAWSNLAAQSAEQVGLAAAPLVAVLALGAGAGETGLLQTAQSLPFLLLSLPAGILADRVSRRGLMVGAEGLRAASLLGILLLVASGSLTLPALALLGFIGAMGTVAYSVAAPSLVPALVPRSLLAGANGRLELARSAAFAAGPALAGSLVAWAGASLAYALAAGLSVTAVFLLARLAEPSRPVLPRRHVLHDLREGAGFVLGHALLRPILLCSVLFNLAWFILQAAYVPYAVHRLGLTADVIGATLGVYGAGMVVGALLAPRLVRRLPFGAVLGLGPLGGLCAALVMVLTLWIPSGWLAGLSFFLFGAGPILWTITSTTLRQAVTPERMLGRVSALVMMASFGARPLGAAIGAFLGASYGPAICIVAAAIGFLAQFLAIFSSPVPRLNELPEVAV